MTKRKSQISPDNVGEYFKDKEGKLYYLDACHVEPTAIMRPVLGGESQEKPISEFNDFVLLRPVTTRTRAKPETKKEKEHKTRSDKGKKKGKLEEELGTHKYLDKRQTGSPVVSISTVDAVKPDPDLTKKVLGGTPLE